MSKEKASEKPKCWWCGKTKRKEVVPGFLGFASTRYYCAHCHPKSKRRR
jgi:hypothetical protein